MTVYWPNKDPDEVLDYSLDFSGRIGTDTISTATWTVPAGITKASESTSGASATIWLSGGTADTWYSFNCRITTAGGRTLDQSVSLLVKDR